MFEDFVQDFDEFDIPEVEMACKLYRQNAKNRFFPKPGDLREIILAGRRERASIERIGLSDLDERFYKANGYYPPSRPSFWWLRARERWKQDWREDEIPKSERAAYDRRKRNKLDEAGGQA